jgi:PAS domain S-box-containing protein
LEVEGLRELSFDGEGTEKRVVQKVQYLTKKIHGVEQILVNYSTGDSKNKEIKFSKEKGIEVEEIKGSITSAGNVKIETPFVENEKWKLKVISPLKGKQGNCEIKVDWEKYAAELFSKYKKGAVILTDNTGERVVKVVNGQLRKLNSAEIAMEMPGNFLVDKDAALNFCKEEFVLEGTKDTWSIIYAFSVAEWNKQIRKSILMSVVFALLAVIVLSTIISLVTKNITTPVESMTKVLDKLSMGRLQEGAVIEVKSEDEIGSIAKSIKKLGESLDGKVKFAEEIQKGNYAFEMSLLGDEDKLGHALVNMQKSLQESHEQQLEQKEEERIITWANTGIAKFAEILRQDNDNLKKLASNLIINLVEYLEINQGAFYVKNDDDEEVLYEMKAAVAYNREKLMQKSFKPGESLVGRCVFEKKSILLLEIPDNYINITSGLGTSNPSCLLLVPCVLNNEVFGALELASFSPLKPYQVEFVEKLGESIASTLASVKVAERTNRLLQESRQQADELSAQEEEMRQNLEEMQATQEDLQRQMAENAQMRKDLSNEKMLMDNLMNYIPDLLFFKDKESKFLRVSNSLVEEFGVNNEQELLGKSDFDFTEYNEAKEYYDDEMEIIRTLKGITDKEERETWPDGSVRYGMVSKLPLLDKDKKCVGTFGISKDITKLKRLDIEYKGLLEALRRSTYIIEYSPQGIVKEINDAYLQLIGLTKEQVLGVHQKEMLEDISDEENKKFWDDLNNGKTKRQQAKLSVNGKKVTLLETYSPVFDDMGKILKVVKIAFDISGYVG